MKNLTAIVVALFVSFFVSGSQQQQNFDNGRSGFIPQTDSKPVIPLSPQFNETRNVPVNFPQPRVQRPVAQEEVPYMVSIYRQNLFVCTGVIVSESYVLTSKSCNLNEAKEIRVAAGNHIATLENPSVVKNVEKIINYDEENNSFVSGVTLFKVDSKFSFGPKISAIKLQEHEVPENLKCNHTLWKFEITNLQNVILLQVVDMRVTDSNICSDRVKQKLTDAQMCARRTFGGDTCAEYDRGGPLVCNGLLTGVASFYQSCGGPSHDPTVYGRISYYKSWIEKQVNAATIASLNKNMLLFQLLASVLVWVCRSSL